MAINRDDFGAQADALALFTYDHHVWSCRDVRASARVTLFFPFAATRARAGLPCNLRSKHPDKRGEWIESSYADA